mgnify:CR=1 FL=1
MPNAIEATSNAAQRVHKGVAAPYGEDGVLLSKSLCGADDFLAGIIADVFAQPFACSKLDEGGKQTAHGNGQLWCYSATSHKTLMHDFHAHGNGNR